MDRALIILTAVAFVLGLYAIRHWQRATKQNNIWTDGRDDRRRREELIQQACERWFWCDLLDALDEFYQEKMQLMIELIQSGKPFLYLANGEVHDEASIRRDKKILMAEMIRLRNERAEEQRAQIERESGFNIKTSARV